LPGNGKDHDAARLFPKQILAKSNSANFSCLDNTNGNIYIKPHHKTWDTLVCMVQCNIGGLPKQMNGLCGSLRHSQPNHDPSHMSTMATQHC